MSFSSGDLFLRFLIYEYEMNRKKDREDANRKKTDDVLKEVSDETAILSSPDSSCLMRDEYNART